MNEEVLVRIDALAAKLGVAAGHLWEILIRQAYVNLAMVALYGIVLGVLFTLAYRARQKEVLKRQAKQAEQESRYHYPVEKSDLQDLLTGVLWVGTGFLCIWMMFMVDAIGYALNPEMFAFKEIASLLGQ